MKTHNEYLVLWLIAFMMLGITILLINWMSFVDLPLYTFLSGGIFQALYLGYKYIKAYSK